MLFLKLSNFRDPFKKTTELFSRLKCLSWGRTPSWGQKVSFLTHPFCFFKLLYIFKYYFRMRGSPWKNRRERWEHFNLYGFQKNLSSLEKKLKLICYNQNKRKDCSCCLCLFCSTAIHIFFFYSMIFVDDIFLKFSFLNFRSCGSPRRIRFSR